MPHLYIFLGLMLVACWGHVLSPSHRCQFSHGISLSTLARTDTDCYSIQARRSHCVTLKLNI